MIDVFLNGVATQLASSTIAELLSERGLTTRRVAVERNGEIVPRSRHADVRIEAGDRLEVVVAVGGG